MSILDREVDEVTFGRESDLALASRVDVQHLQGFNREGRKVVGAISGGDAQELQPWGWVAEKADVSDVMEFQCGPTGPFELP